MDIANILTASVIVFAGLVQDWAYHQSMADCRGAHGPHHSLFNYWLLMGSGAETAIVFSYATHVLKTVVQI